MINVLLETQINPHVNVTTISKNWTLSVGSVQEMLQVNKYHPFHSKDHFSDVPLGLPRIVYLDPLFLISYYYPQHPEIPYNAKWFFMQFFLTDWTKRPAKVPSYNPVEPFLMELFEV